MNANPSTAAAPSEARAAPDPATATESITLGGGCFWCLEAVYLEVEGVVAVEPGYSQGHVPQPSYEQVCEGDTGHAEVVRVAFDPQRIGLSEILQIFFAIHDPTTRDRQGNDVGPQYRSGIYFHSVEQEAVARAVLAEANEALDGRVVTELEPLRAYTTAESYHHRYFEQHPNQGYCAFVVAPKLAKFRRSFAQRLKR